MSYTGYITSDISPMPLLWVAPLSLYLLSFVLVFSNFQLYRRRFFLASWMWIAAIEPLAVSYSFTLGLAVNLLIVFMLCMICHGELASEKPKPEKLTLFYLALSLGGAIGGIFVGLIAPAIFNFDAERLVALAIMGLLTVDKLFLASLPNRKRAGTLRIGLISLVSVFIVTCICIPPPNVVTRERNFYGSTRVTQEGYTRIMYRGRIIQGQEYNRDHLCAWQIDPYVHPVQIIMDFLRAQHHGPIQCAVIGLGTGSYASQGAPSDAITYYELDPKIIQMAEQNFDYLKRTPAHVTVKAGDGRQLLAADPKRDYDAIVVDAFNGDSIPCHLLTLESAKLYLQHLKPSGSLIFHVSNRYVDLPPLLAKLGDTLGMHYCRIRYMGGISFVIMNRDRTLLSDMQHFNKENATKYDHIEVEPIAVRANLRVWTDDFINLSGILKL